MTSPTTPSDAASPDASAPDVSVVVPILREAANVPVVADRVAAALAGRRHELIFVDDDSRDGTVEACAALAAAGRPVRLIVRDHPADGLSGAVLVGLRAARGRWLAVMDGDLQHPPERLPDLLAPLERGEARFTLGSRYAPGGGIAEAWGRFRRVNSRVATWLARPFAHGVRDPMSGFFALPRETFLAGRHIAPTGYKIALELICKCRVGTVREVPILFGVRERGHSKLSLKEQVRYLEHLSRLYDFTFPRAVPIAKFVFTVFVAVMTAMAVFASLRVAGAGPRWLIATLAYAAGIAPTALFHARYVRAQRAFLVRHSPWRDFAISSIAEVVAVLATSLYLDARLHAPEPAEVMLVSFGVGTVVRYLMRKELLMDVRGLRFRAPPDVPGLTPDRRATDPV